MRQLDAPLIRWLIGFLLVLTLIYLGLLILWNRTTPLVVLTWYVPMIHSFMTLAALSIAFLAFGRYAVLREPSSLWLGVAFSTFAVYSLFYVLSWPGLLPGDRGLFGSSLDIVGWYWHLQFSALAIFLMAALVLRWPKSGESYRGWRTRLLIGLLVTVASGWVVAALENSLPFLVFKGNFTTLNAIWSFGILAVMVAGIALSARRYLAGGDTLFGYIAIVESILAYAVLTSITGGKFYDPWWYWQRILWVVGLSVMLFGLLSEYVGLFRRERHYAAVAENQAEQLSATVGELKRLEALREEFISAAAHELKTPVTTIKGYAQMMLHWAPDKYDEKERKAIEAINKQCDRIDRRVREMLEFVRSHSTTTELHIESFDLGDLAAEVIQRSEGNGMATSLLLERRGSVLVEADRERIEEVLAILVDNAVRYSGKDTSVKMVVSKDGEGALISIEDHGVGISLERQPHVFEPFYEPVPSGAAGYRGVVDLGLYLAKMTVERHMGKIWFESVEGEGSTFFVRLPVRALATV